MLVRLDWGLGPGPPRQRRCRAEGGEGPYSVLAKSQAPARSAPVTSHEPCAGAAPSKRLSLSDSVLGVGAARSPHGESRKPVVSYARVPSHVPIPARSRPAPRGDHATAWAPCLLAPAYLSPNPCFALVCAFLGAARGEGAGREGGREMDAEAGEAGEASTSGAAVPFGRSSSRLGGPGAESFDGALRELKDLRSQLHEAADCCEKAFLKTEKKKLILEGTKSYICDAVVAVVDHLGTVSSKLEHKLQEKTDVTQAERKINFLKQDVHIILGDDKKKANHGSNILSFLKKTRRHA
uniref:Uncharacterized protein n=1 Tax=Setaria italica TaxID=4555 RepID=K3XQL3_SETIT